MDGQTQVGNYGSPLQVLRQQRRDADEPTVAHRWDVWNSELEGSVAQPLFLCPLCRKILSRHRVYGMPKGDQACCCEPNTTVDQQRL